MSIDFLHARYIVRENHRDEELDFFIKSLYYLGIFPTARGSIYLLYYNRIHSGGCVRFLFIMEEWKDISGYDGKYQVSNLGNVKSMNFKKSGLPKILKLIISFKGYYVVGLHLKKQKMVSVHRLIAQAFIPNPENKPCINHKDGIKLNNTIDNLEWCTFSENTKHAFETGLKFHTENNNFIQKKLLRLSKSVS